MHKECKTFRVTYRCLEQFLRSFLLILEHIFCLINPFFQFQIDVFRFLVLFCVQEENKNFKKSLSLSFLEINIFNLINLLHPWNDEVG